MLRERNARDIKRSRSRLERADYDNEDKSGRT